MSAAEMYDNMRIDALRAVISLFRALLILVDFRA